MRKKQLLSILLLLVMLLPMNTLYESFAASIDEQPVIDLEQPMLEISLENAMRLLEAQALSAQFQNTDPTPYLGSLGEVGQAYDFVARKAGDNYLHLLGREKPGQINPIDEQ